MPRLTPLWPFARTTGRTWVGEIGLRLKMLVIGSGLVPVLGFVPTDIWWLDVPSHFVPQSIVFSLLGCCFFAFARDRVGVGLSAGALLLGVGVVAPLYLKAPGAGAPAELHPLRVFYANVLTSNPNKQGLFAQIDASQLDLVVLLETDQAWLDEAEVLRDQLPHSTQLARDDNFGLAVYSRHPFEAAVRRFGDYQLPWIRGTLRAPDSPLELVVLHTLPPRNAAYTARRNLMLESLADSYAPSATPTLVIGDLNITPWSRQYRKLMAATEWVDFRRGQGMFLSWPAHIAVPLIPIDHILFSPGVGVREAARGEPFGSDHLPLSVRLDIPAGGGPPVPD